VRVVAPADSLLFRLSVAGSVVVATWIVGGGALAADQAVVATSSPNAFVPANVTVNQGERVTWRQDDEGPHNVVFPDGFREPSVPSSSPWTRERIFNTVGTFSYVCGAHPTMIGTVTVLPAGTPGGPPGGGPPVDPIPGGPAPSLPLLKVTLKVSDSTPSAGTRVRLFGVVRPARDGRKVQIQKRARTGDFRTVTTTRLREAGTAKSEFSLRLRVSGDALFRARVTGDDERATGVSRTKKLDVQPPR
jgi:plastocyanin